MIEVATREMQIALQKPEASPARLVLLRHCLQHPAELEDSIDQVRRDLRGDRRFAEFSRVMECCLASRVWQDAQPNAGFDAQQLEVDPQGLFADLANLVFQEGAWEYVALALIRQYRDMRDPDNPALEPLNFILEENALPLLKDRVEKLRKHILKRRGNHDAATARRRRRIARST